MTQLDVDPLYEELVCEFELTDLEEGNIYSTVVSNNYVQNLVDSSGLHVLQEAGVQKAYSGSIGYFIYLLQNSV